ncbi:Uncharacterised protein [uncultured archaeon]|nr:Uncharacterised protein [uncultured archaeon]
MQEKTKVGIPIKKSFYRLLDELGQIEAKENIDNVLDGVRIKKY